MEKTYIFEVTEGGTIVAKLKSTGRPVSEYDKKGTLLHIVDWLYLPVQEYVDVMAKQLFSKMQTTT